MLSGSRVMPLVPPDPVSPVRAAALSARSVPARRMSDEVLAKLFDPPSTTVPVLPAAPFTVSTRAAVLLTAPPRVSARGLFTAQGWSAPTTN